MKCLTCEERDIPEARKKYCSLRCQRRAQKRVQQGRPVCDRLQVRKHVRVLR